jgi:hypothetical protein
MSILPESLLNTANNVIITKQAEMPKKTFIFDFDKKEFVTDTMGNVVTAINNESIVRGVIEKIFNDARYRYLIYDNTYGNEIGDLIAQDEPREVFDTEIKRLIREALVYHPFIKDVTDINVTYEGESAFASFVVESADGIMFSVEREVT